MEYRPPLHHGVPPRRRTRAHARRHERAGDSSQHILRCVLPSPAHAGAGSSVRGERGGGTEPSGVTLCARVPERHSPCAHAPWRDRRRGVRRVLWASPSAERVTLRPRCPLVSISCGTSSALVSRTAMAVPSWQFG
jgi:hypothetical protein